MWRKGNPLTLLVGMQTSTATMENRLEFSKKKKKKYMYTCGGFILIFGKTNTIM